MREDNSCHPERQSGDCVVISRQEIHTLLKKRSKARSSTLTRGGRDANNPPFESMYMVIWTLRIRRFPERDWIKSRTDRLFLVFLA